MKFTLSWLSTFVDCSDLPVGELTEKLTMLGLEVEAVVPLYQGLDQIVTARITRVRPHPNADRLTLCDVDCGESETVQVVCGAPNVREGMVSPLARPGVRLPDGMKIKKAKVRGEVSLGMLCSARELGLSDDHSGIMELDDTLEPGVPLTRALDLDDTMIEVDLTPNRPDCASVLGIAREVAAFTGRPLTLPLATATPLEGTDQGYTVTIENPDLCPRYAARKLSNVRIGPSPWWLQRQLLAVGMRPINNVVDITNFVMLEYGQPLHAFDFARIRGGQVIVRCSRAEEKKFTTLDGIERSLDQDMLMICDGQGPVAVAGVMGGLDSEVSDQTTEVLLEAACFDPVSIRRTARRLNLPSEASYRFERGVDPDTTLLAQARAVALMVELAGAEVEEGGIDLYPGRKPLRNLDLRISRAHSLLGIDLESEQIAGLLSSIGLQVESGGDQVLRVTVPAFRPDLEREVDLIEEVARLYGYNEVPTTMPVMTMECAQPDELRTLRREAAAICLHNGFYEAINYSFTSESHLDRMGIAQDDQRRQLTRILNPLTEDQAVMRSMLLSGLLENLRHNIRYQQPDLRLFEIGKIFLQRQENTQPEERFQLCAVLTGSRYPGASAFHFSGLQADILDIKGLAESLINGLRLGGRHGELSLRVVPDDQQPYVRAGSQLSLADGEQVIGRLGEIEPRVLSEWSIKQPVFFLEMDLDAVAALPRNTPRFQPIPRYPMVRRDIALLVPEQVSAGDLLRAVRSHRAEFVESVELFDVYSGKPIDEGMKSVALSVTYRSDKKTLDDETVDRVHEKIVQSLMKEFGGRYREGV